jgi:hypothetical protein
MRVRPDCDTELRETNHGTTYSGDGVAGRRVRPGRATVAAAADGSMTSFPRKLSVITARCAAAASARS